MRTRPLTYHMRRALENVRRGDLPGEHVFGAALAGGFTATMHALQWHRLLIWKNARVGWQLTRLGRSALRSGRYGVWQERPAQ